MPRMPGQSIRHHLAVAAVEVGALISSDVAAVPPSLFADHESGPPVRGWKYCRVYCRAASLDSGTTFAGRTGECPGRLRFRDQIHESHRVALYDAGGQLLATCEACGAYAVRRAILTSQPCSRRIPANRRVAVQRILIGKHPWNEPRVADVRLLRVPY